MKKRQKNKPRPSNIGRRTGVDVVQGKKIRRQDDGTDVFDDYWTDSDSTNSSKGSQSVHSPVKSIIDSENVSILDKNSVSFKDVSKSSMIRTLNQRSGEYEDHNGYFKSEKLKKSRISGKKLNFSEDIGCQTGVVVVHGKKIPRQDDGTDVCEDYWTDNDSISANRTIQSIHSPVKNSSEDTLKNVSVFHRDSVSFVETQIPYIKETSKKKDHKPEQLKKLLISKEKYNFSEDVESSAIARSKMTQTSHLFDETGHITGTSHPLNEENGSPFHNTDSFDKERNVSVERDSGLLSKTLSSPNSKKNINKRDSLSEPPQCVVKSSERLNQKKNVPSSNRKNVNKSEILVSGQRGNDLNEKNKRKSSTRKSPIAIKKKDTLENSLSEASCVENRLEKEYEDNFSGEKSNHLTADSSDVLNAKQNASYRGNQSVNRSESLVSCQNENHQDEVYEKSSTERSARASKSSKTLNSEKKANKENSLNEPSQCTAKSTEVLNQKENIHSKNEKDGNKSEILVSGRRKNDLKDKNKRKSSTRRSSTAIKRKIMHTPDTLENSLSKTSCVENRWKEKNFSGEKSNHHTDKFSDGLNAKQNIFHGSNNSVNRSEISVSRQKENDHDNVKQKSSIKRSPRASDSNAKMQTPDRSKNRQVSVTADSRKKIAPQDAFQENASSCTGIRRSSRYKRPPLASWRNERLKFVKASDAKEFLCVGVEKGQPEDDFAFRVLKKRYQSKVHKYSWKKPKNVSKNIEKTPILNDKTGNIIDLYLHRPFSLYEWTFPPNVENPGYMISRTFKSRFMTFGFLDIAGRSIKGRQHSPQDNLHFVVIRGVVKVVINTTSFTFQKGDSFIVPVGTFYSIKNKISTNALLSFSSFRIPFFQYQESE